MPSLSAAQADCYYLPPAHYGSGQYKKKKSKNHHNQFLQNGVVRFELPYKGICQHCQQSIGRGTRYNAKKMKSTKAAYFSTPIWEFQMTCRNCQHPWIIHTNPKERGFDYVSGVTLQAGQEDTDNQMIVERLSSSDSNSNSNSKSDQIKMKTATATSKHPLERLESAAHGQRKARTENEQLQKLQTLNQRTTLLDADVNATIRSHFRKDRKEKKARLQQAANLGWREGMELLTFNHSNDTTNVLDTLASKETVFGQPPKQVEQQRWKNVRQSSIFTNTSATTKRKKRRTAESPSPIPLISGSNSIIITTTRDTMLYSTPSPDITTSRWTTTTTTATTTTTPQSAPRTKRKIQAAVLASLNAKPKSTSAAPTANVTTMDGMLAAYGSESDEE